MDNISPQDSMDDINRESNSSEPQVQDERLQFVENLHKATPVAWVTPAIVVINSIVFVAMVASGVSIIDPKVEDLLKWGADFGPFTVSGEWWRLLTSAFVHIGIIHIALNMWCLWDAGRLAERIFGNVAFVCIYILSAVGGSLASICVNPVIVSAGASGAVFGVFGSIGAFIFFQKNSVPPYIIGSLKRSILPFIGYNLVFGFVAKGIDNAAHIGGLVTGFAAGVLLARAFPVTAPSLKRYLKVSGLVLVLTVLGLVAHTRVFSYSNVLNYIEAEKHFECGNKHGENGDYDAAVAEYTKVIQLEPNYEKAYYNRGLAYAKKGEYDKAISDYTKAIDLDPKDINSHVNRGVAYAKKEEYDKAISDFTMVINIDSINVMAYGNRGTAYAKKGEHVKAISDFTKVISLDLNCVMAYGNRGVAYAKKEEYDKAVSDFTKVINLDPKDAKAYYNRGKVYVKKGEYDKAISDYTKTIELDPSRKSELEKLIKEAKDKLK